MTFQPSAPEKEEVKLVLSDSDIEVTEFTEYSFNSNFLEPTDGWSFTIGFERLRPEMQEALVPGAAVKLVLNGIVQSSGYIDSIEKSASRSSGTEWRIEGRDRLGQVVDACADPTQSLKESMTVLQGMKQIFGRFGWSEDEDFLEDGEADRELKAGIRGRRRKSKTAEGKGFGKRAIKAAKLHQYRPYMKEGAFEFASRIAQRHGLWIWTTADGEQLILSEPNFESAPEYKLIRRFGESNVLEGSVKFDINEQPTHIVADSHSHAGEFATGRFKVIMANTVVRVKDHEGELPPELEKYIKAGARLISSPTFQVSSTMVAPRFKVTYLKDDESQTLDQLESYVRREMALLQRGSLAVNYTVEGHGQINDDGWFVPWTVDSTVDVEDEVAGLFERLYVFGRTFNKSRSSGTTTTLELIRLNTLRFSSTGK